MKKINILLLFFVLTFTIYSCKEDNKTNKSNNNNSNQGLSFNYNFVINNNPKTKLGDTVKVDFTINDTLKVDSAVMFIDNKKISTFKDKISYTFDTKNMNVGRHQVDVYVYAYKDEKEISEQFVLLSDITPKNVNYKILKTYSHDPNAYTQGLFYFNGVLYESTGLETKSTLRKVEINTGKVLQSINVNDSYFGEGIAILNDKIYMLTWQDHIAMVFDLNTFKLLNTYNYTTEGWGLTTDGNVLYLSDGSNFIYIVDPKTFTFKDKFAVYDNNGPVNYLNELEYVNGVIYANVYTFNFIVVIDPKTGKVLQKLDFSNILPDNLKNQDTDVLNGIAYNYDKKTFYITGKNWPVLFEIALQ